MIRLVVNSKELVLNTDVQVKYTYVFPDPSSGVVPGAFVSWFMLPPVKENDAILNYSRFTEVKSKVRLYENVFFQAGDLTETGTLIVQIAVRKEGYKVSFTSNPFPVDFKDAIINGLDLPSYNLGSDADTIRATAKTKSGQTSVDTDFVFPTIKATDFYPDGNQEFLGFMNYYSNGQFQKNTVNSAGVKNINTLVPMFYMPFALSAVFESVGFTTLGDLFQDAELNKSVVFNNFGLDKIRGTELIAQGITAATYIYTAGGVADTPKIVELDSEIDPDNLLDLSNNDYEIPVESLIQLSFKMDYASAGPVGNSESLLKIILAIDGDPLAASAVEVILPVTSTDFSIYDAVITYDASITDVGKKLSVWLYRTPNVFGILYTVQYKNVNAVFNPISHNQLNEFEGNVYAQNHLPPISVSDFTNNLAKYFGLAIFTDTKTKVVRFDFIKDIIANPEYIDFTDVVIRDSEEIELLFKEYSIIHNLGNDFDTRSVSNYILEGSVTSSSIPLPISADVLYFVTDLNRYALSYFDETSLKFVWRLYKDNFGDINETDSQATDIDIDVSSLPMTTSINIDDEKIWLTPDFKGNGTGMNTGTNDFDFILLQYHGFHDDGDGDATSGVPDERPLASNSHYDKFGNSVGVLGLQLNGSDGVYEAYLKSYYEYVTNRELITFKMNANEKEKIALRNLFSPGAEVRKLRIDNQNYLPVQLDIVEGMDGLIDIEIQVR